jgi:hypothetical protein
MKKIILALVACLVSLHQWAQAPFNCSSHLKYAELLNNSAEFRANQQLLEDETRLFLDHNNLQRTNTATYIIPVVFHVIHTGGAGNISDAQIMDQISILNKEFPRQQADTSLTPAAFKALAAPFSVEFRLATIDPSGNCTNGINRIYSTTSTCSVDEDAIKSLSYWPSNKYLNIWLVESMHYWGSTSCNGGGYATFPGGAATLDGINIRSDLISSIGTSATNTGWGNFRGRYLIHELGHWFNLRHIWGDANCGDDLIADTPPAEQDNYGCPSFPQKPFNACGGDGNGEMFTNYMDYTNGSCLNMFTIGQVTRMTAAINSSVSGRNNLWKPANLVATGTSDPYTYPVACTATPAMFPYTNALTCIGDSVRLVDVSYGGNETSRTWNFFGQNATSLTDSIVYVKYNAPGIYNVELTINSASGSKTKTFANKVYVLNNNINSNYTVPFTDSFENTPDFNTDWVVINKDNDAVTWQTVTSTNYSGSKCIGIMNSTNIAPAVDELISPAYNLSAPTVTLNFKLHFASKDADSYDKLQVFISSNCGKSWSLRYSKTATSVLKTTSTYYTSSHIPAAGSTEWRQESINMTNIWGTNPVRFKFAFTSGGGNNLFIDDININSPVTTNINNLSGENTITLFPNPAGNDLNISYRLKTTEPLQLEVIDVLGKTILSQTIEQLTNSETTSKLNIASLADGVYFLKVKQQHSIIYNTKFIKQH